MDLPRVRIEWTPVLQLDAIDIPEGSVVEYPLYSDKCLVGPHVVVDGCTEKPAIGVEYRWQLIALVLQVVEQGHGKKVHPIRRSAPSRCQI